MDEKTGLDSLVLNDYQFECLENCFTNSAFMIPSLDDLKDYGYDCKNDEGIQAVKPISKLQALKYKLTHRYQVYLLREDDTETAVSSVSDILEWDGYFGIDCEDESMN